MASASVEPEEAASGKNDNKTPQSDGPTKPPPPANGTGVTPPPQTCATTTTEEPASRSRVGTEAPPQEAAHENEKDKGKGEDKPKAMALEITEYDDFGLPIRPYSNYSSAASGSEYESKGKTRSRSNTTQSQKAAKREQRRDEKVVIIPEVKKDRAQDSDSDEDFKDAVTGEPDGPLTPVPPESLRTPTTTSTPAEEKQAEEKIPEERVKDKSDGDGTKSKSRSNTLDSKPGRAEDTNPGELNKEKENNESGKRKEVDHSRQASQASTVATNGISEYSHQQVLTKPESKEGNEDAEWQEMPAYARYDMYDDNDKLIAREHNDEEEETYAYAGLGGAGKGYTRVVMDDDAESATSMDENTQYLFKDVAGTSMMDDDEQSRDAMSQMQATKDLLTEGQRIAYVGVTRLELSRMVKEAEELEQTRRTKKLVTIAAESTKMWAQKMMIRLYGHMEISSAEQIMIEQLAEHDVRPEDLTPALMRNSRVKNPMAEKEKVPRSSTSTGSRSPLPPPSPVPPDHEKAAEPPPEYQATEGEDMPDVKMPSELPSTLDLDIDLRWTVLCDLFLVLVADSVYDSRSRCLLERVGKSLEIPWIDICRFEKRVTDALEMQQAAEKENWNEDVHMETRRKMALKRRYVMMGLATVGGGLVIGLSAGLLAPMIGAGLAAGFTTIGVGGTSGFLAGAGGAAVITSGAAASGSIIGVRAANRRTGAVKTFEYRPLHNNKRVNLIITVSGWMTGKVDDVRLPYSTVDSIMGDIYSVLWEPEMLRSMGDTINILATEALTQGLQQVLGSTILMTLMAALQLPIVLTKLSYLIDNPWAVSLDRATAAGLIMADSLIDRNLGTRPVTLVGYSLGARVIFSCLQELAKKGAHGLIQNVYMFGSPIVVKKDEYLKARTVVSGRFVNAYNRNDWILGYLFRLTNGGIRRIAGLAAIDDVPSMENMDVTELVPGHMEYRTVMPRLLRECGWLVESDEFSEIEDPDPENHQQRQRELISEIEEARKELEKEGKASKGGAFNFFRKKKALERAEWELYEDTLGKDGDGTRTGPNNESSNRGVLFDVDAIRAELAKEKLEVKELQSTLPPMKLDISADPSPGPSTPKPPAMGTPPKSPMDTLQASRSAEAVPYRSSAETASRLSAERTPTYSKMPDYSSPAPPPYQYSAHSNPEPEPEIQMTFDTAFTEEKKSAPPPPPPPPPKHPYLDVGAPQPERPGMQSSKTLPNIPASNNPWADPDDDDFGKEQEISMTFA